MISEFTYDLMENHRHIYIYIYIYRQGPLYDGETVSNVLPSRSYNCSMMVTHLMIGLVGSYLNVSYPKEFDSVNKIYIKYT